MHSNTQVVTGLAYLFFSASGPWSLISSVIVRIISYYLSFDASQHPAEILWVQEVHLFSDCGGRPHVMAVLRQRGHFTEWSLASSITIESTKNLGLGRVPIRARHHLATMFRVVTPVGIASSEPSRRPT
jgi:hypothetical protein